MQLCYLYLLPSSLSNVVKTSLRRHYPMLLSSFDIVVIKIWDKIAKTTSLQCLIMTAPGETLQRCRFWNFIRCSYRNSLVTLGRHQTAMLQQRCKDAIVSTVQFCLLLSFWKEWVRKKLPILLLFCWRIDKTASPSPLASAGRSIYCKLREIGSLLCYCQ